MSRGRRLSRRAKTPPSRASRPQRGRTALPFCESGGREKVFACLAPFRLSNRSPFVLRRGAETGFASRRPAAVPLLRWLNGTVGDRFRHPNPFREARRRAQGLRG